jgi:HD-GYP domain-containing protein (c-di-GMP phosphodiesterase class II)
MRGLEIVSDIGFLDEALSGIMHHHERMDGRGYPMGLVADEIPEFARVIAVADTFDSMTSDRSYRRARSIGEGIAELRSCAGSQFDAKMVEAFTRAVRREGWKLPDPAQPRDDEIIASRDHDDPTMPLRRVEDP